MLPKEETRVLQGVQAGFQSISITLKNTRLRARVGQPFIRVNSDPPLSPCFHLISK